MDTVVPTDEIDPVLEDGVFRNLRPTILGADDKAAVAALLHATELLLESGEPFAPFELLLHRVRGAGRAGGQAPGRGVAGESGGRGLRRGRARGAIVVGAPSQITWKATFSGKAAHAGLEPEKGRNAILAAARAIASMELGRLDDETTANVGIIEGAQRPTSSPSAAS